MKRSKIIDAEFTVVREPPAPIRRWNGVGVPPDWPRWSWAQRVTYVVLLVGGMTLVVMAARWLAVLIVPPR